MTKRPGSAEPWHTSYFVVVGAIAGIFIATIRHMVLDHSHLESGDVLRHFFPEMVTGLLVGAIVLGGVSAVRNWLKRRP